MHNCKHSSKERAMNYTGQNSEQWIAEYLSSNVFDLMESLATENQNTIGIPKC